jgi:hypothetical protein
MARYLFPGYLACSSAITRSIATFLAMNPPEKPWGIDYAISVFKQSSFCLELTSMAFLNG